MADLYKGIAGSPITYLASDISANQTTISIADDSVLPPAPNICTIGYGENLETIKYEQKSNGVLQEVTRGIEGTPRAWLVGTEVARFFTAYDHNSIIEDLADKVKQEDFDSHLAESAYWIRVDNLSAPLYIGDSRHENQAVVPMSVGNSANKIFAIKLSNRATLSASEKQIVIIEGNMSGTGRVIPIWTEGILRDVRPPSSSSMAFYMNATENVYIHAIYLVKDMEV